jgi:hypothetical protein
MNHNHLPISISLETATTLLCEGAAGLCFYLPVEPVCGRPGVERDWPARKSA